ncbi:MAG: BON domain-containing protein [Calditrichia bacterium]
MLQSSGFNLSGKLSIILVLLLGFATMVAASDASDQLADRVEKALGSYYETPFQVTANDQGVVSIKGTVNSLFQKYRIFDIVATVPGVKDVEDYMTVNTGMLPDSVIAENIRYAINANKAIAAPQRINVRVENGIVYLTGTVSYYREKVAAQTSASWEDGVKGIQDELKVLPPKKAVSDANLQIIIKDVLHDRFRLEKNVSVTVDNGVVTLNGTVQNLWDKLEIAKNLSDVLGVKEVVNHLTVQSQM